MTSVSSYIWAEKYRPKNLSNMILEPSVREIFMKYVQEQNIPHLLLYGSRGSGKTTMAKILIQSIPCSVLMLNASGKDRSVEVMRTDVVNFARSMPKMGTKLKIVFMDESDGLTVQAQESLRNTMETYSDTCRFILTANHVNRIIDPLRSRCVEYGFTQFSKEQAFEMCKHILKEEGITSYKDKDLSTLIERCYPDIRTLVNTLQRCSDNGSMDISKIFAMTVEPKKIILCITTGKMRTLRQMIAGMTDFMFLYKYLFDNIQNIGFPKEREGDVANSICQHLYYDSTIPDREINFTSTCAELAILYGAIPDFNK